MNDYLLKHTFKNAHTQITNTGSDAGEVAGSATIDVTVEKREDTYAYKQT